MQRFWFGLRIRYWTKINISLHYIELLNERMSKRNICRHQGMTSKEVNGFWGTWDLIQTYNIRVAELLGLEMQNITHYHEYIPSTLVIYRDVTSKNIQMKILYSGNSLHSLPATLNLVNNFQLELLNNGNYRIYTKNAPMHRWEYGWKLN